MAALLLVSQGAPMILGGDELGRSQGGNNNAYCQDNETSWVDWRLRQENRDLFRFFQLMIRFRKAHPALRRRSFVEIEPGRPWVRWQGTRLTSPDWSADAKVLGMHLDGEGKDDDILILVNAHPGGRHFELPPLPPGRAWHRAVDTFLPTPDDIAETGAEPSVSERPFYEVGGRAVVVLVGR
jgi:glycogen operon protein